MHPHQYIANIANISISIYHTLCVQSSLEVSDEGPHGVGHDGVQAGAGGGQAGQYQGSPWTG